MPTRVFPSLRKIALGAAFVAAGLAPALASAADTVKFLILKEQGVGSAATAQQYVDKLMDVAAQQNGWTAAEGKYQTRRASAQQWVAANHPHYGILSLGAFLSLRGKYQLEVIGKAEVAKSGGREYHIVSSTQSTLAGCKGKALASNHAEDTKFVDNVVAGGAFALSDFDLVTTRRPMQTVKSVTKGESVCALIDDAQFASMKKVEGGQSLTSVWKSAQLPPMVVVAFPSASGAEKAGFKRNLGKLCTGSGKPACEEVGIRSLKSSSEADYKSVISKYGR